MSFSVVDEIYKSYIGEDMNKDTEKANKYFDELFEIFNTLNLDLQNKISFLLADYSHFQSYDIMNVEEIMIHQGEELTHFSWNCKIPGLKRQQKSLDGSIFKSLHHC